MTPTNMPTVVIETFTSPRAAPLRESATRLDELVREDRYWVNLLDGEGAEFSAANRETILRIARLMEKKNPLIACGVSVAAHYVFGQGVTIKASEWANEIIQAFLDDEDNQVELTSNDARIEREKDLKTDGEVFFALFTDDTTGRVVVRTIPPEEIKEIITDPDDRRAPWYYRRCWSQQTINIETGRKQTEKKEAYYPCYRYLPPESARPARIGKVPVMWDAPILHVAVNRPRKGVFGLSELYCVIDWAKSYKNFLEDWATITRAHATFAWEVETPNATAAKSLKTRMGTTLGTTTSETNPPSGVGATAFSAPGYGLKPVKTAGATTKMEDGRRLLLMICAGLGLPETFFGDVSVGTLATAESLDRPTELRFLARRLLWAGVITRILMYVLTVAARTKQLDPQYGEFEQGETGQRIIWKPDPDNEGKPYSPAITVDYPPLLDINLSQYIPAVMQAATAIRVGDDGYMRDETISRILLTALGADNVDEEIDLMKPLWEQRDAQKAEEQKQRMQAMTAKPAPNAAQET